MFKHPVLVAVCGLVIFLVVDLIATTVYVNSFDSGYAAIRTRFERGERGWACDGNPSDEFSGRPSRDGETCTGGILAERDVYLASEHIHGLGTWRYQGGGYETFYPCFRYWF